MKLKTFFFTVFASTTALLVQAQTTKVTKDELRKYAIASDSLRKLTEQFSQVSLKTVNDPKIPVTRQQQLAQTQGDSLKLVQIKATPYEKAYLKKVRQQRYLESSAFRDKYAAVINDYVGSDLYTRITSQLKNDRALKHQYDSITSTLTRKKP